MHVLRVVRYVHVMHTLHAMRYVHNVHLLRVMRYVHILHIMYYYYACYVRLVCFPKGENTHSGRT